MEPTHIDRFYENILDLIKLIQELIGFCYDRGHKHVHPLIIGMAAAAISQFDRKIIIDNFIKYSWKFWDKIIARDQEFIAEHADEIFFDLDQNHVDAFKMLYTSKDDRGRPIISQEDLDAIWDYFDSQIKICIKYIHENRKVVLKSTPNGMKPGYTVDFFPEIKLSKYTEHYRINLKYPGQS